MKLRDFVVVAVVLDLLLGVFLFGLLGGFAGGVLLPENLKSKVMETCSRMLVATAPATPATPAIFGTGENGNEECDAAVSEKELAFVSADFLEEMRLMMEDVKTVINEVLAEQGGKFEDEAEYESSKNEYDESVRRYWAKSGQPMPK